MVVTAPRPPQTEELEGKMVIILVASVFWNYCWEQLLLFEGFKKIISYVLVMLS